MQLICEVPDEVRVTGEDWDSLMWHNGKLFSGSFANGKVQVWSGDLKPLSQFLAHEYPIYHMTPGPGTTFFTSSFDCTIKHWEEKEDGTYHLLATLEGHTEPPRRLCFFNGKLYSGDDKGIVNVWQDGSRVGGIETMEEIWDLLVTDGEMTTVRHVDVNLFSISEKDDKVRCSVKNSIPGRGPLQFGMGKKYICCIDRNDNIINVHKREEVGNPKVGQFPSGHGAIINAMASVGPGGKVLVTGASDNQVVAWNLQNFTQYGKVAVEGYVNALATNPEGKIYAGGENKFIVCLKV